MSLAISIGIQMNHLEASKKEHVVYQQRIEISLTTLDDIDILLKKCVIRY